MMVQAGLSAFGAEPVTSCKFDFSTILTDVPTMAATARVGMSIHSRTPV